uniref:CSON010390 protein n=1 Tax=Culicoides sonorensis TaxID=179676 RepID=A0A336LYC1_CULSO
MEFMKLFVKNPIQENKFVKEPSKRPESNEKLDHFPLKSDCEINCIKQPHFPCKGMHRTEPKPMKLTLTRRDSVQVPPPTASPTYPPNHPWFQPTSP